MVMEEQFVNLPRIEARELTGLIQILESRKAQIPKGKAGLQFVDFAEAGNVNPGQTRGIITLVECLREENSSLYLVFEGLTKDILADLSRYLAISPKGPALVTLQHDDTPALITSSTFRQRYAIACRIWDYLAQKDSWITEQVIKEAHRYLIPGELKTLVREHLVLRRETPSGLVVYRAAV